MGLASALNTALTGMTAAETTIDVVGNNLANSNTVGFKASQASFATQFLQTQSLGSAPTNNTGGVNPRQVGLGAMVGSITPNFSQGTIQISSSATDLAIQGDGFFIVRGSSGEFLYTRNGVFKMNAENELTTITGNRVQGYGVNANFEIDGASGLVPLKIPLGSKSVAQATRNVYLQGSLTPTGDLATQGQIVQTEMLSDGLYTRPDAEDTTAGGSEAPAIAGAGGSVAGSMNVGDEYAYRLVTVDPDTGTESMYDMTELKITIATGENGVHFSELGETGTVRRLYRTNEGADASTYKLLHEFATTDGTTYDDLGGATTTAMNTDTISGEYTYYVTYYDSTGVESCPSQPITARLATDGRIQLNDLPTDDTGKWNGGRRIYRNLSTSEGRSDFHLVYDTEDYTTEGLTWTDNLPDSEIEDLASLDFYGPRANDTTTLAVNVMRRSSDDYVPVFSEGTFQFTGSKGGRTLTTKEMEITETTTLREVLVFMSDAMGIVSPPGDDPEHPIPPDSSGASPGFDVTLDGQLRFISNGGIENAVSVPLTGMRMVTSTGTEAIALQFATSQDAVGQSAATDMVVYDSLGESVSVRLTAVLESRTSSSTTYRWFADSAQNISTTSDDQIAVGTGLISFDGNGNYLSATNRQVQVSRDGESAANSPLTFDLDFSQISGLATDSSSLAVSRQDGSGTGTLSSFIIGNDGTISGVFSNGATRTLGQVRLVRFSNPAGLEQKGENLYASGVNSGEPVGGGPGEQGIGQIIPGAQELSNTDIGANLVDLILASTMYRGNTRVVTTVQQMLDELLALRR